MLFLIRFVAVDRGLERLHGLLHRFASAEGRRRGAVSAAAERFEQELHIDRPDRTGGHERALRNGIDHNGALDARDV